MQLLSRVITCLVFFQIYHAVTSLQLINNNVTLTLEFSEAGVLLSLALDDEVKLSGRIGEGTNDVEIPENCEGASHCFLQGDQVSLNITAIENEAAFIISWESSDISLEFIDCFDFNIGETFWYGGAENYYHPEWPIENVQFNRKPYIVSKNDYGAISERYWLNSKGAYIFIDDKVPLFLDQNNRKIESICYIASVSEPYLGRERVLLNYTIVAKADAKEAHLHAVRNFLGQPQGHPDERIIRKPIWTTWAKYKKDISDEIILSFAQEILDHGFTGQLEIDDFWETCYGSLTFNEEKFDHINSTVKALKEMGFTVTLWSHPFVNDDCVAPKQFGEENDYFVVSRDGGDVTSWWDGDVAYHIDFSKENASDWFINRLKLLQEKHGIDSFKFDAGENDWAPPNLVVDGDIELAPNSLTSSYMRAVATFGGLIEVRSGWRTQQLSNFVRIIDRDSRWGLDNGLHSLITTLLTLNINGYTMVLPDIIGGDAYDTHADAELLARWIQANAFMPAMQFSDLPWDITSDEFDGLAIITKFVALHEEYADVILEAMNNSISNGTPVNPPIWWLDPTNVDALQSNDEYLLGEMILVAPVIEQGATSRDIVLPKGSWKDGNNGEILEGPQIITDYPAPIDVLPFFIRQK